ncbi:MAG: thioredoxin-dependent thiol peroxidase [Bacteroidota bacterium]|nr:thioredoxin-dependent thiol peroxidase [Bacteroidota bacterium]
MTHLKPGDKAPGFSFENKDGKNIALKDFLGKKVILYFYPKDNTPGCTAEACNLRDNYKKLQDKGFEIIGISMDTKISHDKFITKLKLPFKLIPDTEKTIIRDYGVWGEKKNFGKIKEGIFRTTFIIDETGKIEHIFKKVQTKNHTEQILSKY